ncbi:MAG: SCO family protein [Myxococcota bacterium]
MAKGSVRSRLAALCAGLALVVCSTASARPAANELADRTEETPKQLRGVDVQEHLGNKLPLDLPLRDATGKPVKLGDFFDGRHPVLLTLNYSNCPMLCSLQLNGLVKGLKEIEWGINQEFRVVTVSLDPTEPPETTQATAKRYLTQYGRPEAAAGWHFLTGSAENVHAYASALGLSYRYDEKRKEYAHPAALVLASPSGNITRYLYGIEFQPKTLRLGLVEASEGRIGSTIDKLVLYCFHYDSSEGRYAPVANRIMQVGGAATVVVMAGALFLLHRADKKRKRRLAESTAT